MRLIDADALEVFVKTVRQGIYLDKTVSDIPIKDSMLLNFQQYVHLQPTIDAVSEMRSVIRRAAEIARGDCRFCLVSDCCKSHKGSHKNCWAWFGGNDKQQR